MISDLSVALVAKARYSALVAKARYSASVDLDILIIGPSFVKIQSI